MIFQIQDINLRYEEHKMTENIENKTGNSYNGFRKVVEASILGALCFVGGYSIAMNNNHSNKNERIQTKDYSEVSKNDLEKKTEENIVVYIPERKHKVNSLEISDKDKDDLEKRAEKTSDIFVYVEDINSGNYELRIKLDKLSEKEKAEFISKKGVVYNKKEGYISFNSEFEDKELYNSMKDLAILSQVCKDNDISDEERKFVKENAPDIYNSLISFKDPFEESEIKREEKKKKDRKEYDPKEHPFLNFAVDLWLRAQVANEERKIRETFLGDGEIIITKDGRMYGIRKGEKIPKYILDETTEPPKPLDLK